MTLRPDLNGLRMQQYGDPRVYLVDQGQKRWIPSPAVMGFLFRTWTYHYDLAEVTHWDSVILDLDVNQIDDGPQLPNDSILFMADDSPKVFLRDTLGGNYVKRWITSPDAMDRFQFDWGKINHWNIPLSAVGYPDGPNINWP